MAISDVLIELLSFSKPELYQLAEALRLDPPRGDKLEIARLLAQEITLRELREAAGAHLGAGRTSLSWVVLTPADELEVAAEADSPLTAAPLTIDEVTRALRRMTGARNPYRALDRPDDVTPEPVLVNVQHDSGDDLVFFTLAYQRSHRMVVRNFRFSQRPEDDFFHVVLRLSRGVIEVRAEARLATKVTRGWISLFARALGRQEMGLFLTQRDVDDLREALGARMDRHEARHEDEDAGYGRQLVTASATVPDLVQLDRFHEDFEGSDPVASDLLFDYLDPDDEYHEVRIRVSPRSGTVRCVNHVSNDVMEYVYDTLRKVRAERIKASSDGSTTTP